MTAASMRGTAAVVLAAGLGTRFGGTKALAELRGRPLVDHVVATALDAGLEAVVVVLGPDAERVRAALPDDPRVTTVHNDRPTAGLSRSLRLGVTAVPAGTERLVVLLADQPGVAADTVGRVLAALPGHAAARARYRDVPGHPVAFAAEVFERLTALTDDVGARHLLDELDTVEVAVDRDPPPDVDTRADLDALRR